MTKKEFVAMLDDYGWDSVLSEVHRESIDDSELAELFFTVKQAAKHLLEYVDDFDGDDLDDELYVHDTVDAFELKSTWSDLDYEE